MNNFVRSYMQSLAELASYSAAVLKKVASSMLHWISMMIILIWNSICSIGFLSKTMRVITTSVITVFMLATVLALDISPLHAQGSQGPGIPKVTFEENCVDCGNNPLAKSVVEGYSISLTLVRVHPIGIYSEPLTVFVNVTNSFGQFLKNEGTRTITFPAQHNRISFTVSTIRYRFIDTDGSIDIEIADGPDYDRYEADNENYRRRVFLTVESYDTAPVLQVISDGDVEESGLAKFWLVFDKIPSPNPIRINYTISQMGDFLHSNNRPSSRTKSEFFQRDTHCPDPPLFWFVGNSGRFKFDFGG